MVFDYDHNKKIHDYLMNEGDNFIYIYGANDTWTAAGIDLIGSTTNSVVVKKEGGDHTTRIRNLGDTDRDLVVSKLADWLGIDKGLIEANFK
jgi:hypothetical protein